MQEQRPTFGTLVTCIDGRAHRPVTDWMRSRFALDYVDIISEPGPDKLMADGWPSDTAPVHTKVGISIRAHASKIIALCGHHDCAANPATDAEHRAQISAGVRVLRSWGLDVEVIGLWANERWEIEIIEPLGRA